MAVQCAQREAGDGYGIAGGRWRVAGGAGVLAGLGEGDQLVERGADRFGQGEGRKVQGLHEAAEDAQSGLLPAI